MVVGQFQVGALWISGPAGVGACARGNSPTLQSTWNQVHFYVNIANQQMTNYFKFLRTKGADAILTHTMLTKSARCPTTTKQIQPDEEIIFARCLSLPKDLFSQDD